jgi:Zn-dependent peptidase ImmA (M78 family)/transcriptional regulator with XRE-family HTH domain
MKATVHPELLRWARERAARSTASLAKSLGVSERRVDAWESSGELTLKQVEKLAKATHTPVGYLFLHEPPVETVPIPDFRTAGNQLLNRPSPDLLETIYLCQRRQAWYRENEQTLGGSAIVFIGSALIADAPAQIAARMRAVLRFSIEDQRALPSSSDTLRRFIEAADDAGVMVMCSGVVHNDTRRVLDPGEFRGFALADPLAPLVFVNGADSKGAQMFTLAHELAHLWLGSTALSDSSPGAALDHAVERWCNRVAAEFLVPSEVLRAEYRGEHALTDETSRLSRAFKVSSLVMLLRLHELGFLTRPDFEAGYAAELARLRALPEGSGGNFYLTQTARLSKRFARALVVSTLEGRTLYRDAMGLVGVSKLETFHELARRLGVSI